MKNKNKKIILLSHNFGYQIAITVSLDYACGDYVAIIDADLQGPPELTKVFHLIRLVHIYYKLIFVFANKIRKGYLL